MKLLNLFIKKEVLSVSIALLIVVLGLFALKQMPIRLFPQITSPIISITTSYPGASAEVIKSFVTSRLENAIAGLPNISYITASSTNGSSQIEVYLLPNSDVNAAMVQIMEKVNEQRSNLPTEVKDPLVEEEADDNPAMIIAFTSNQMSRVQVAEYLRRVIEPEFEIVNGVSSAEVMGRQYAIRINLNPKLLLAYGLTATDVLNALNQQNVLSQAGSLEGNNNNFDLEAMSHFINPEEFNNLLIKEVNNNIIRLKDIGQATFTEEDNNINAFYNNNPATMVFIKLIPGANPLTVSKSVLQTLAKIKQSLPYDMQTTVVLNEADYIHESIKEVLHSLFIAFVIILFVLVFFLGSFRAMTIPLVTIPISLIGAFFLMNLMGFSINTLSLLAMVLAVGLVVDDAIVVVENIFRHLQMKKSKLQAVLDATQEVFGAIIAMTLTLAAVFAPIFFMGGITGTLFSEFAFALVSGVLISGFIALTLTPMMCSKILSVELENSQLARFSIRMMTYLENGYHRALIFIFKKRAVAIISWVFTIIGCFYLYHTIPQELAPKEDQGFLMIMGNAPANANQNYVLSYRNALDQVLSGLPGVSSTLLLQGVTGLNGVMGFAILKPWGERAVTAMALQPQLQMRLSQIAGVNAYAIIPGDLPGSSDTSLQFVIVSTADYKKLYTVAKQFEQTAMKSGLFSYLNDDLNYNQPELQLEINRNALAAMNVDMNSIGDSLALLTGELQSQQFTYFGHSYDVILSASKEFRRNPDQLNLIYVRNNANNLVPLSSLIKTKISIEPSSLNEFQKQNAITINGMLAPGKSLSEAITYTQTLATHLLPPDMSYDYSGDARQYMEEGGRFVQIFSLSLIIIFLILGIQFNSFRDSLLILLGSVPMALFAALIPLKLGFGTINIYTQIALLTLVGLIAKHGVLMTKFANQLKEEGAGKIIAIQKAALVRFRPILMTTVAMVFGTFPLVFAKGAGSVSRFEMGLTIAVGLTLGTFCTLFIFPVLYHLFSRENKNQ
ncbi:MAG: hypothetical protein A3E87_08055 [Gammaproteobacteria bacterium RIFCSPHIGHO2_12_FULL_35_23]|nr:MAG: hypothetical protein A3E87_08055 [Gammaproteobacteria bacterium RIFCSPHIGHO2_12_FULL_35_23]